MVGHLLEYHPGVVKLKELIDSGELGRVLYIYGNRLNLGKLRADENALWSLGAHDVSVLLRLAGEEPYEVEARGESYMREGIEDVVFCFLRFPSGLAAHLHLSWLDPHKERRFTVVGEGRMATFDDMALEGKITVYDKGFDEQAGGLVRRVHHALGRHLEPAAVERRAAADRVRALRPVDPLGHQPDLRRRGGAARGARARGTAAVARRDAPQRRVPHGRTDHVIDARALKVRAFKALTGGSGPRRPAGRPEERTTARSRTSTRCRADVFDRRSALRGIHFDLDEQVAWIEQNLGRGDARVRSDPRA